MLDWFVKAYECAGGWCYFGERVCSNYIPWHYLIGAIILFYSIIYLLTKFRKGGLFGVPRDLQ